MPPPTLIELGDQNWSSQNFCASLPLPLQPPPLWLPTVTKNNSRQGKPSHTPPASRGMRIFAARRVIVSADAAVFGRCMRMLLEICHAERTLALSLALKGLIARFIALTEWNKLTRSQHTCICSTVHFAFGDRQRKNSKKSSSSILLIERVVKRWMRSKWAMFSFSVSRFCNFWLFIEFNQHGNVRNRKLCVTRCSLSTQDRHRFLRLIHACALRKNNRYSATQASIIASSEAEMQQKTQRTNTPGLFNDDN